MSWHIEMFAHCFLTVAKTVGCSSEATDTCFFPSFIPRLSPQSASKQFLLCSAVCFHGRAGNRTWLLKIPVQHCNHHTNQAQYSHRTTVTLTTADLLDIHSSWCTSIFAQPPGSCSLPPWHHLVSEPWGRIHFISCGGTKLAVGPKENLTLTSPWKLNSSL